MEDLHDIFMVWLAYYAQRLLKCESSTEYVVFCFVVKALCISVYSPGDKHVERLHLPVAASRL